MEVEVEVEGGGGGGGGDVGGGGIRLENTIVSHDEWKGMHFSR